jgi:V/A-type H+-transporting ATPase subunit G/H
LQFLEKWVKISSLSKRLGFADLEWKGGDKMSLEAIKKVTETEQDSMRRKSEAAQQAKKTVTEAERAGQELLERSRQEAEAKVKEMMADAERRAAEHAETVAKETESACKRLRKDAEGRLDKAAALIVRRVVND